VSGRYLFATWDGSGNLAPTLAAAASLHERGHRVRFVGHANQRERVSFPFRAWETVPNLYEREPVPPEDVWWDELFLGAEAGRELDAELRRERVDVAVVDCLLWGALAAVEQAGVPAAVFVHTIYGRRFSAEDWPPRRDRLNRTRALFGLEPVVSLLDAWHRLELVLVATARCFDRPREPLPENTIYCGPLRLPVEPQSDLPWQPDVVVSFSTASISVPRLTQRVLDALAPLPVRSAVSSSVPNLAPAVNTVVREWLPHDLVLPGARVVITHGGHGSVLAALLHGLPVLCLPLVADQPFVSQLVVDHGAGIALPPSASASEIRAAVEALLSDERFAAAARVLANGIARELAADAHVTALEALLR
jgi:UDP:flavonoid glycosyltransferase YjiC (YdhE family)